MLVRAGAGAWCWNVVPGPKDPKGPNGINQVTPKYPNLPPTLPRPCPGSVTYPSRVFLSCTKTYLSHE